MLLECHPELVVAIGCGNEIQIRDICWIRGSLEARRSGRSDGPWWQTLVYVGVVRRLHREILVQHPSDVVAERVLDRWISLEQHAPAQSVVINSGDDGPFFRNPGLLLDNGRHRYEVVSIDIQVDET